VQQVGVPFLDALNKGAVPQIPQVGGTTPMPGAAPMVTVNFYGSTLPTPEEQQVLMRDLAMAVRP
jgi:hypothetical protein